MKKLLAISLGIWCLLCLPTGMVYAADDGVAEKTRLHIGIAGNRAPYAYLDKDKQPQGILVMALNTLCDKLDASCEYVSGEFNQLLEELQTYQIHALIVIDGFVAPEIDRIKLTPPLCKLKPVFIQRADATYEKPEDFKGATLGVGHGSLLHLYLLDEYSSLTRLRPYHTLESGVFDLVSGRIDALFTEQAFFQARVASTVLANETHPDRLISRTIGEPELPTTSMTLAVRERDTELLAALEEAIQADGKTLSCTCLLDKQQPEQTSPNCSPD